MYIYIYYIYIYHIYIYIIYRKKTSIYFRVYILTTANVASTCFNSLLLMNPTCRNHFCKSGARSTWYSLPWRCKITCCAVEVQINQTTRINGGYPCTWAVPCCSCSSAAVQPTTPWCHLKRNWMNLQSLQRSGKNFLLLSQFSGFQALNSWGVVIFQDFVVKKIVTSDRARLNGYSWTSGEMRPLQSSFSICGCLAGW